MTDPAALPAEEPPLALAEQVPAVMPFMPFTGNVAAAPPPPAVLPPMPSNVVPFAQPGNPQPVTGATGLPPVDMARLSTDLVNNQRNKMITDERINRARETTLARDQARTEKAYQQTGIGPDSEINSRWNADEAREKYRYDPVKEFGSIGSLFAIAASAFTKRPMENALAGSAAAMNAVKEGNAAEYDRAYKAWQDNTNLAIKRQGIMQQQYQNSISMMTTNMAAGEASMKINAVRFGDKETLALLENGMSPQVIDLLTKRNDLTSKLEKSRNELSVEGLKTGDLLSRTQGLKPGSLEFQRSVQTWQQDWNGRRYDEDSDFSRKWHEQNPNGTAEEFGEAFGEYARKVAAAKSGVRTQKPDEAEINRRRDEKIAGGMNPTQAYNEAVFEVGAAKAPTPNRLDQMSVDMNQMDNVRTAAQANLAFLENYTGGAGIAGKATRLGERVGNIFGTDNTARVDFEKRVNYMKMVAPRLLTASQGRPLASEAERVNSVIAGLGWGDTTANTIAAMRAFDTLLEKMQADVAARRQGKPNLPGATAPAAPSPSEKKQPWFTDPPAKRSDLIDNVPQVG